MIRPFWDKPSLGCAGIMFDGAALGFATGGAIVPEEMAAGYGVVMAPYAIAVLRIDSSAGLQRLGHH